MRLNNKIAVITGGASGIGRATAERFAREGASVVVADRNMSAAVEVAGRIGRGSIALEVDVSESAQVQAMIQATREKFDRIDILINNAGFGIAATVVETEEADWDRLMAVNLRGIFLCSKYAIPVMAAGGGGSIVNTGSYTAVVGIAGRAAYVASKGAIVSLTRAMALDHVGQKIRVNAVAPGTIASPYFDAIFAQSDDPVKLRATLEARAPMNRMGRPEEIANAILWLASDEASFATGSVLTVDGGTSIW